MPLHERMAFYSVSDAAVVTATRDGMNLVPYEYIVCRQVGVNGVWGILSSNDLFIHALAAFLFLQGGPEGGYEDARERGSMLVVSGGF